MLCLVVVRVGIFVVSRGYIPVISRALCVVVFVCSVMPCFHPLEAWRGRNGGPAVFSYPTDFPALPLKLPCGQCIGCRLERSRQWAVRCMHEASLHDDNCFITLTYSDEFLPVDGSLNKREWQLFAKRLRARVGSFRFFHCGEYGERLGRPHYHACLFGYDFPDKVYFKDSIDGSRLYTSELLSEVWPYGHCTVGAVTFESAAYVARYVMKKVTGDDAVEHYMRASVDGEVINLQPEYVTMSRRPGIARGWLNQFINEVFPADEVISRGFSCKPPRYYDSIYEAAVEPSVFDELKRKRVSRIRVEDATPSRLRVRETCAKARVDLLKRPL